MIFKRDPALWLFLVATVVRLVSAFFIELSPDQQAWLNAAATGIASLIVALIVKKEGQVPAILGAAQAIIALAVGFGLNLSAEQQAVIMSMIGAVAAMFVRTQVEAPVTINGDVVRQ
jgi:hypothetical protein